MSITIQNAKFINKKIVPKTVSFTNKDSEKNIAISVDRNLRKNFKNILTGKYVVESGVFKINGFDKVNKQWTKKKVAVLKANYFFKKWPKKIWLFISLLLNKDFYNEAKIKYYDKKYAYLSYSTSNNNYSDLKMREKVEQMILKFIENALEIEEQWLSDFFEQIIKFNDENLVKQGKNFEERTCILISNYFYLIEKTKNLELLQTFLQTIWDKVYSFMELSSLCACEYKAKKSNSWKIRKLASELNFKQINFIARKQLKIIDVKVNTLKRKIAKNNFIINNSRKQLISYLLKSNHLKKRNINLEEYFSWRKASNSQRYEFEKKQNKMFFEGLADEATTLRGKIVEVMHKYHKAVLNGEIIKGKKDEFFEKKEDLKKEIKTIYKQSILYINETANKLGIEFNLLSLSFDKLKEVWFHLLIAINLKKYNLIFYNVLSKTSKEQNQKLLSVVDNIFKINSKFSVTFIEKGIYEIPNLNKNIYIINEKDVCKNNLNEILKKYWSTYGNDFFAHNNKFNYKYNNKKLETMNEVVKIDSDFFNSKGQLIIDPLKVYTNKKDCKKFLLEFKGKVIAQDKFADKNIYKFLEENKKINLYFYSEKFLEENQKINLFISEESILKII